MLNEQNNEKKIVLFYRSLGILTIYLSSINVINKQKDEMLHDYSILIEDE